MGKPRTLSLFARKKRRGEKIVVLTAYDLSSARIAARGGVDALLVGDSLGMVVLGHENTLPVTVEDVVHHARAVRRARPEIPVIADLPYGAFHVSARETVAAALRLVKEAGVSGVKLEGGRKRRPVIEALLNAEIPVMGHLGLTPQSIHRFGGYKVQGRGHGAAELMLEEARFLDEIGCFAMVLECVPRELAARITAAVQVPTIGIGAGPECDGQVLVYHDLLGLFDGVAPRFVKRYAELSEIGTAAVANWAADVRATRFPAEEQCYTDQGASGGSPTADAAAEKPRSAGSAADAAHAADCDSDAPAGAEDTDMRTPQGYLASLPDEES